MGCCRLGAEMALLAADPDAVGRADEIPRFAVLEAAE